MRNSHEMFCFWFHRLLGHHECLKYMFQKKGLPAERFWIPWAEVNFVERFSLIFTAWESWNLIPPYILRDLSEAYANPPVVCSRINVFTIIGNDLKVLSISPRMSRKSWGKFVNQTFYNVISGVWAACKVLLVSLFHFHLKTGETCSLSYRHNDNVNRAQKAPLWDWELSEFCCLVRIKNGRPSITTFEDLARLSFAAEPTIYSKMFRCSDQNLSLQWGKLSLNFMNFRRNSIQILKYTSHFSGL